MASILEVSPGGRRFFNVFDAAPENEVSSAPTMANVSETDQTSNSKRRRSSIFCNYHSIEANISSM
jgi:hypothetical protein